MITLGLVGGVACGKSAVANDFQKLGACIVDGDRLGHAVVKLDHVLASLVDKFGRQILDASGELERRQLAQLVFGDEPAHAEALKTLESITHPEIEAMLQQRLADFAASGRYPLAVLDAAVMLKSGWDRFCDKIAYIDAPADLRLQRALLRGLTAQQFHARERSQTPLEVKKSRADFAIDNSGSPLHTFQRVQEVWQSLVEIA